MGDLVFANTVRRDNTGQHHAPSPACNVGFEPFDPAEFMALCWAMKASAEQLEAVALKAALHRGDTRRGESQEAYIMMMLGSLAAIDKLRRRMMRT